MRKKKNEGRSRHRAFFNVGDGEEHTHCCEIAIGGFRRGQELWAMTGGLRRVGRVGSIRSVFRAKRGSQGAWSSCAIRKWI